MTSSATWTPGRDDFLVLPGHWSGTNTVHLDWGSLLSGLGSGDVLISIQYVAKDRAGNEGPVLTKELSFTSAQASSGVDFSWQPEPGEDAGGLSRVLGVTLKKKDQFAATQTLFENAGFGPLGQSVYIAAPDAAVGPAPGSAYPGADVQLLLRYADGPADTGWFRVPLANFGDGMRFDASGLDLERSYEYKVLTLVPGQEEQITAAGVLGITPRPLVTIGSPIVVDPGAQNLQWQGPGGADTQVIRLRVVGSNEWIEQPIQRPYGESSPASYIDLAGLAGGQYEYELLWSRPGETGPYAHATGTIDKVAGTPDQYVVGTPESGVPRIDGLYTELRPDGFGNFFNFIVLPPPPAGQLAAFFIRIKGSTGAWLPLAMSLRMDGRWEVNVTNSLVPGSYEYSYSHTPPGGSTTAHAVGDLDVSMFGGISLTDATEPYVPAVPGYTIPGTPAQYDSAPTDLGPYPVSQDKWLGGRVIGRTATLDGTYAYQRPVVNQNVDRWGNVVSISDPRSAAWVTTYRYNANNQLIEQVQVGGFVTSIYYDQLGRQVAVKDANGHVNGQEWDAGGNLVREIHADGGVVNHAYDAFGNRVLTVDAMGNPTRYLHDKLDHLIRTAFANGIQEHQRWDAAGRLVSTTNGENETIRYAYDLRGNLVRTTQPMGQVTEYAYDAHNRKVYERDANQNIATWSYDYFGALTGHSDIGGASYSYTYDNARQLIAMSNTRGQNQRFSYDEAGRLVRIQDDGVGRTTTYRYDLAGRHIRETTVQNGETYQDNHIAYDELGRMRWVADGRVAVTIDYDAVGNRTHIHTHVDDLVAQDSDRYYQYDQMNRQTVVDAVDPWGNLGAQGHALEYDKNGNRVKDTSADGVETYVYDELNRLQLTQRDGALVEQRDYDAAHRVIRTTTPAGTRTNQYNANGRLVHQDIVEPGSTWSGVNYDYDAVGNLTSTLVADFASQAFSGSTNTYEQGEGYWLKSTANVLQSLGELVYNYDANGQLVSTNNVYELNSANRDHIFINDAAGNVLHTSYLDSTTHQPVNAQRQLVVTGEVLGRYGDVATGRVAFPGYPNWTVVNYEAQADFSFGYQGINSQYPVGAPASRIGQDGDTLRGLAQATYGNAALWYVIAEANGLSSDADLVTGQVLKLPPVVDSANNADTFRPYDPSRIANDTPTALPIPQGKGGGCGGIGQVIVAIVVVVVAVVSQQYYLAQYGTAIGATAEGAAVLSGAGAASAVGAGTAVWTTGSMIAAGAIGGAVGSIVGQGVGIAIGAQDSFSWKGVALGAIGGGVAGGLSGVDFGLGASGNRIAQVTLGNVATQGVAVATGLQSSFSWKSVAIAAVSAGVTQGLQSAIDYKPGVQFNLGKSIATSIGGSVVTQLAVNGRINTTQLATDAFGNVLGDSLARGSVSGGAAEKASDDRAQNIASMLKSADRAAGSEDSYFAGSAGKSAWPMEVSSQAGYLSSMFPEPQVVASDSSGPVPTYLYDTDALASGVIQRNVVGSALPAGPSLASAPDLGTVEGIRASGLPYYDGLVASNNSLESAAGRVGRGLFNAGYDFAATGSSLYELGTNADLRARAIMNGVNAIAHPIDTTIGIYNAGESYFKNASIGQIGEDGIRLLAGTAIGGAGSKGLTLIGDLADGATAVGRLTPQLTAEGLPYSRLVAGGGLDAHEAAGGHLLAKHVGQTEQALAQRLANEPWISGSSSFYDRSAAEAAISRSLDAKQAEIASWLGTSKPQTSITFTLPENVGITMSQGSAGAGDTASLKLILRRDASMPTGYRIHTGYPE